MIVSFANQATEDIFDRSSSKVARKLCPQELWAAARRKLDALNQAEDLQDLRSPPGNRLEALKGEWQGQHSIRINAQYRIRFVWTPEGPSYVEVVDYH